MKEEFIEKGVWARKRADARPAPTRCVSGESAITLIALVITIIVLLILAGVTIAMVVGDNGILTRAREAKSATEIAEENEKRELARAEAAMNMENFEYVDENGDKAIIPAGFAPTRIDGENKVEDGLVITDSEGNEFVWIPVKSREEYQKKIGNSNNPTGEEYIHDITDINELQQGDDLGVTNILGNKIESGKQDRPEIDIVVDAGGFYVGRYEAGVELNEKIDWESNPEIVVKKNVQPVRGLGYKYIIDLANNWKVESNVQSGLITGTQWDVMCNFIGWDTANQNCQTWGNYIDTESYKYSGYCSKVNTLDWIEKSNMIKLGEGYDNVEGSCAVFPTGAFLTKYSVDTAKKNIYDIAGNVFEFTTEIPYGDDDCRFRRGGDAGTSSNGAYATLRKGGHGFVASDWADGFRLVLYVNK